MSKTKYLLLAALGVGVALLLTSDKTEDLRDSVAENARRLKNRLNRAGEDTADRLQDLRKMVRHEVEGLSDDARERIKNILNESNHSARKIKRRWGSEMA